MDCSIFCSTKTKKLHYDPMSHVNDMLIHFWLLLILNEDVSLLVYLCLYLRAADSLFVFAKVISVQKLKKIKN